MLSSPLFRYATFLTGIFPLLILAGSFPSEAGMALIAGMFLLHSYFARDWNWCNEPWAKCLLALWVYMIARGVLAQYPLQALGRALPFGRYFIFAAALGNWTFRDESVRRRFFMLLTGVLVFCALDGLLQWFTGHDLFRHAIPYDGQGHIRLTGPFTKPCLGIMLAWLFLPPCFRLLMTGDGNLQTKNRLVGGVAFALTIVVVIALSGERMALLLALFGLGIAVFLLPLPKRYMLALPVMGIALIAVLALISPDLFQRQILTTVNTFTHWQESPYGQLLSGDLHIAAINPIFGIGTMHFRYACQDAYAMTPALILTNCNTHPHNIYMEWLIENGVIGLILFAAAVIAVLQKCCKAWPTERLNPVFIGLLIAFILRIWPIESSTGLFSTWGSPPMWLMLGLLLSYCIMPLARLPAGLDERQ